MSLNSTSKYACPIHKKPFTGPLFCSACNKQFPSVNGIPILINDDNSVFKISDYLEEDAYNGASGYGGSLDNTTGIRKFYRKFVKALSETSPPKRFGIQNSLDIITDDLSDAKILIIGSGDTTIDIDATYTDVAFGQNVQCIADAHDLPFTDQYFDACIAVAVLEHVADPYRCVQEIRRVLKTSGYVYAETPFMQPVHMGAYDFTRFTYLGHRRLFKHFEEIRSGIALGPGSSAGQILRYAIASLTDNKSIKKWLRLLGLIIAYPLRWMDQLSESKNSAFDSASGFYFFGRLSTKPISDRELIKLYKGG